MAKKTWVKHNKTVFKSLLNKGTVDLEKRLTNVFYSLAESVKIYIEEIGNLPHFTGNLADSTGVGVYHNGVLKAFAPMQSASMPQMYRNEFVWGKPLLERALEEGSYKYPKGIWVVLYSTVPYAVKVDTKGTKRNPEGYFSQRLVDDMLNQFKLAFAREFPNIKLTV